MFFADLLSTPTIKKKNTPGRPHRRDLDDREAGRLLPLLEERDGEFFFWEGAFCGRRAFSLFVVLLCLSSLIFSRSPRSPFLFRFSTVPSLQRRPRRPQHRDGRQRRAPHHQEGLILQIH